jgi:hypothetical protein
MLRTLIIAAMLATSSAQAQSVVMSCHNASSLANQLAAQYKEDPVAFGVQSNGNLMQVYKSEKTGTWTILSTSPSGVSCIVAVGNLWEQIVPANIDPEA